MLIEVKRWPESQDVMDDEEWFFVMSDDEDVLGPSAYGRIIEEEESEND